MASVILTTHIHSYIVMYELANSLQLILIFENIFSYELIVITVAKELEFYEFWLNLSQCVRVHT